MRPEDHLLVGRDPDVPGLALALDDAALLGWLDPRWRREPGLAAARVTYLRYKPGTAIIAGLELTTNGGTVLAAAARFVAADGTAKIDQAARHAGGGSPFPAVLDHETLGVVVPARADRRLPGLRRLLRADRQGPVTVLRYKPERRLVARVGERRLVKAHRPDRGRAAGRAHAALLAAGAPVAPLLGTDRHRGLVTTRWVDGLPADHGALDLATVGACGKAVGRLHRSAVDGLRPATGPVDDLAAAAAAVAAVVPDRAGPAQRLALDLTRRLPPPVTPGPVHGDFSADQVVFTPKGKAVLLDVDSARLGDPADDIGSFAAAAVVDRGLAPDDLAAIVGPLLEGVARAGGPGSRPIGDRLGPHVAAAVLRRAAEPFRTRHPSWSDEVRRLLRVAHEVAELTPDEFGAPDRAVGAGRPR